MKRFWREVSVSGAGPFGVMLDGRAVRTPGKAMLELPSRALADAVAGEWAAVEGTVKPEAMPMTGLANAAIDLIAADRAGHAARLAAYAGSDLVCYRAEGPDGLVMRQAAAWDPVVDWARARLDLPFVVTEGLMPVAQPAGAVERVAAALAGLDAFGIAACAQLVPISGSALLVLALLEGVMDAENAFAAASVDEAWSEERWGQDDEATAMLQKRAEAFLAAHRFLVLARADG
jgi:chaperone required for assembly of F1-ATPase